MMTNGCLDGKIFLSHPHTIDRLFFLLTIQYCLFIFFKQFSEVPDYTVMRHNDMASQRHYKNMTMTSLQVFQRMTVRFISFPIWGMCDRELYKLPLGKNSENSKKKFTAP